MSDSGKSKVRAARGEIESFLAEADSNRIRVDVTDLSHAQCARVMFGGALARLGVLFRYFLFYCLSRLPFSGLKNVLYRWNGVKIGRNVYIAPYAFLDPVHPKLITIDDNVMVGMDAAIVTHERTANQLALGRVHLEENACIGGRSIIRHGVTVGKNVTVDMMVSLVEDVPDNRIVVREKARYIVLKEGTGL